jgi:ribosomal protein S18 acetylase RimI-like enzyme
MMEVHTREAQTDDLGPVSSLFTRYLQFYGRELTDCAVVLDYLQSRMVNHESTLFIAIIDGEIIGFAQLYPSFNSLSLQKIYILHDLFVHESARGRGVASKLLNHTKRYAIENGAYEITLQTANTNFTAQSLYERHGYKKDDLFSSYCLQLTESD